MTTNIDIPSPFEFEKEPRICDVCDRAANYIGFDFEEKEDIYRCPCGELKYQVPEAKN